MLDIIAEFTRSEIQKHPLSSMPGRSSEKAKTGIKYPGSCSIANGFHRNVLSQLKHFFET